MTPDRKEVDREWLLGELVDLLRDAKSGEKVEHIACAKYVELLYKMLPPATGKSVADETLDALRRGVQEQKHGQG